VEFHLTATGRHLPYGITQCYLPPDTSERAPPSPQPVGRYSIYLPRRDGRLSSPRLPGNAPAGNRTRDLSITSPTLYYHYTQTEQRPHHAVDTSNGGPAPQIRHFGGPHANTARFINLLTYTYLVTPISPKPSLPYPSQSIHLLHSPPDANNKYFCQSCFVKLKRAHFVDHSFFSVAVH